MSGTEAVPQESKDQAARSYRRSPRGSRRDMTPWGQCWGELARGEAFVKLHQHPLVCAERHRDVGAAGATEQQRPTKACSACAGPHQKQLASAWQLETR